MPGELRHLRAVPEPPRRPDDSTVVRRALDGDVDAWSALYAEHYPEVFRHLRYLTGDAPVAEELAQETFAQAMAGCRRYDEQRRFGAWLHGIALNVARKHWRKRRNRVTAHARMQVLGARDGQDLDHTHLQRERSRALYDVLREVPDRLREAFILRELEGLSTQEVCEQLRITPGNLSVRINRARARIRAELDRRGWNDEEGSS